MAKTLTDKKVEKLVAQADGQDQRKIESQAKQGKEFVNHGQGVIPEAVWKNLPGKKLDDAEAVK